MAEARLTAAARLLEQATAAAVEPHDFGPPTGLGLRCVRPVPAGGVLLEVPIAAAVTAERARDSVLAYLEVEASALPEVTPQDFLCLWLLLERRRGEASEHTDYIAHLPRDLAEMSAAYWPDDVLQELEPCEAHVRLTDIRERVEAAHRRVAAAAEAAGPEVRAKLDQCLDLDSYVWARCILNSRQFEGSWCSDTEVTGVLMPPLEMFNHCCKLPLGQCLRRGGGGQGKTVEVLALRDFAQGEEAMISYGAAGSSQLLERGFAVEDNKDDSVDLILEVQCSELRLPQLLRAAPDDAEEAQDFEWLQAPAAGLGAAEARITLRRRRPLPPALLALVRLECLSEGGLQEVLASSSSAGAGADALTPLGQDCERATLGRLLAVAEAMLGKFQESPAADTAALEEATGLRRMAIAARLGEKEALCALAAAAHARLLRLLAALGGRTPEPVGGSVWFCYLRDTKPKLEAAQQSGAFAQHFRRMQTFPFGGGSISAAEAVHAGACSEIFLWLHDHLGSAAAGCAPKGAELRGWAQESASGKGGAYLQLYFEKMALWGRYLAAQFAASGGFALSDMNTMQMETVGIRNSNASSVPTSSALAALAAHAPLLEVGCGNGLWAQLLKDVCCADVLAFDTATWDTKYGEQGGADTSSAIMGQRLPAAQPGGPEKVEEHPSRTLVLMWPDHNGSGLFGTSCLERYSGERLLLVGEWRGSTYGTVNPWGQSFSEEFVRCVERDFELEKRLPLPCWPLALDCLMVWKRRMQ